MTVHLIHGFNVSDGGKGSVGKLTPYVGLCRMHDYGWTGLLRLRATNASAVKHIGPIIKSGDVLVAHSNGAMICWSLAQMHSDKLAGIILINPALRRDTIWPNDLKVMCIYNSTDWVVSLGRMWSRLVSLGGLNFHGWGAAGRYGFNQGQFHVTNWDSAKDEVSLPAEGHSGLFKMPQLHDWGTLIGKISLKWARRYKMNIKYLVIHVSDSPPHRGDTAKDIHLWHKQRGWDGIGYNAVITGTAKFESGRPDYWQGAHVRDFDKDGQGDNSDSLGICIITDTAPDDAQLRVLEGWVVAKLSQYPGAEVVGHRDLDSRKTCPNMDVPAWWSTRVKNHIF